MYKQNNVAIKSERWIDDRTVYDKMSYSHILGFLKQVRNFYFLKLKIFFSPKILINWGY